MLSKRDPQSYPLVVVAVLNYKGKSFLKKCLRSLQNQTYPEYRVVLIDNGSGDGSVNYVKKEFPWVDVIVFNNNLGYPEAYNRVISRLKSEFVALLNMDTEVERNWLEELVKPLIKEESIAASGSKVLLYDQRDIVTHAGGKFSLVGGFGIGFLKKREKVHDGFGDTGWANGCSILVRRSAFLKIGGFDNDYFAYAEELDFCWRAWLLGYKVVHAPSSIVYHAFGGSWGFSLSPRKLFLVHRNRLMTIIKNFELKNLMLALFFSATYDLLNGILMSMRKQGSAYHYFSQLLRAEVYILKNFRSIIQKRRRAQKARVISDDFLSRRGLLAPFREEILQFKWNLFGSVANAKNTGY